MTFILAVINFNFLVQIQIDIFNKHRETFGIMYSYSTLNSCNLMSIFLGTILMESCCMDLELSRLEPNPSCFYLILLNRASYRDNFKTSTN